MTAVYAYRQAIRLLSLRWLLRWLLSRAPEVETDYRVLRPPTAIVRELVTALPVRTTLREPRPIAPSSRALTLRHSELAEDSAGHEQSTAGVDE